MESAPPPSSSAVGTFFNVLERLVLFALALIVGVINLLIAVSVAAHMGVIPKAAAARILRLSDQATAALTRAMDSPDHPATKHKTKP